MNFLKRLLAKVGLIRPPRGYYIECAVELSTLGLSIPMHWRWHCRECASGTGSASSTTLAHRDAMHHMLAAHGTTGGDEPR